MKSDTANYTTEFELLKEAELGDPFEPVLRVSFVSLAGVLIYVYTGWHISLIWPVYFVAALGSHSYFIHTRQANSTYPDVICAALLFANLQVAFGWFPTLIFLNDSPPLHLVGGALICAQLLFLVRRSDTLNLYHVVQVLSLIVGCIIVYVAYIPTFDRPLAYVGPALALMGLVYYFLQSLRLARRLRMSREDAARKTHQIQKMAAIGQLAGGVAHDFNNNLTAIIGSLELAQLNAASTEQQADLSNALTAARQAATTVKHLLIFARLEKPDIAQVSVAHVFCELTTLTKRLIPSSITFQTQSVEPELLMKADRHQLLSGLINLVANSVDAMPKGGVLDLSAARVRLTKPEPMADGTPLKPGDYVKLTVSDTGHGIPNSILADVIDPFFTTKPAGKGTGLGLSSVAGLIKELGGGLSIKSSENGTEINLFLTTGDDS